MVKFEEGGQERGCRKYGVTSWVCWSYQLSSPFWGVSPFGTGQWLLSLLDHVTIAPNSHLGICFRECWRNENTKRSLQEEVDRKGLVVTCVNGPLCLSFTEWESSATFCFHNLSEKWTLGLIPSLPPALPPPSSWRGSRSCAVKRRRQSGSDSSSETSQEKLG
jgi:hypothetical protein